MEQAMKPRERSTLGTRVYLTQDEEWNVSSHIAEKVQRFLETLQLDTYNERYVIKVTVDQVSPADPETDLDEE
jgi:hypothetical protein